MLTWNGTAYRGRRNPTLSRRQAEALALHAGGPPGETVSAFCRRAGISRDTWYEWRAAPAFAAELARVEAERLATALEPLREALPRLVAALIERAETGDVRALRAAGDWLGLGRKGGPSVQVAVDVGAVPQKSLDELLAERKRMAEIVDDYIDRHREDGEERVQEHDDGAGAS